MNLGSYNNKCRGTFLGMTGFAGGGEFELYIPRSARGPAESGSVKKKK